MHCIPFVLVVDGDDHERMEMQMEKCSRVGG